jgi:hypothetical protein
MVNLTYEILEGFKDIDSTDKDYLIFNVPLDKISSISHKTLDKDLLPDPYPIVIKKDYLVDLIKNKYIGPALIQGLRNGVG